MPSRFAEIPCKFKGGAVDCIFTLGTTRGYVPDFSLPSLSMFGGPICLSYLRRTGKVDKAGQTWDGIEPCLPSLSIAGKDQST